MKTILLIGKMNEIMKELNEFLSKRFKVQVATDNAEAIAGLLKVTQPDLVMVSLVGMYYDAEKIFVRLQNESGDVPVITVGIKEERDRFLKFYDSGHFENVSRPVDHSSVLEVICGKLGISVAESETEDNITGRKKVLVVDDNGPTLRMIKSMIEEEYDVQIVPSGMKAMTSIGKSRPDLILLDYEMPVCDGRQTLEMIRADDEIADIPVIFLTSVNDRTHIEKVLALKPQGYLLKPPVKDKLLDAIGKALKFTGES
ncbi:MAG: response regulator [Lachnospiraceae bacterium]|nr:response regulator [Lachnospiraceae bacterium]